MKLFQQRFFAGPTPSKIFGLDVLRSIAILGVLISHGQLLIPAGKRGWFGTVSDLGGYLGVELFFVLSGFLIGSIILSLRQEFGLFTTLCNFWVRRWLRTIPNYLLFLALTAFVYYLLKLPIPNIISFLVFTQNWLSPHPHFFGPAWSLSVEEWFYLLFPLGLYLTYKSSKSFDLSFLLSAGTFVILPTIFRVLKSMELGYSWDEDFRKVMFLRLDAIMYGVLIAWVKNKYPQLWVKNRWLSFVAGIFILTTTWYYNFDSGYFFSRTFLFMCTSIGFALLIPLFDQWINEKDHLIPNIFRNLANWSYSLYLCNYLIIILLLQITQDINPNRIKLRIMYIGFYFLACLIVSCLTYLFFEKPIMDLRNKI